eukprot:gene9864-biopygen118188
MYRAVDNVQLSPFEFIYNKCTLGNGDVAARRHAEALSTQDSAWVLDAYNCSAWWVNQSMPWTLPGTCHCVDNACVYMPTTCVFSFTGSDDIWDFLSDAQGAFDSK